MNFVNHELNTQIVASFKKFLLEFNFKNDELELNETIVNWPMEVEINSYILFLLIKS